MLSVRHCELEGVKANAVGVLVSRSSLLYNKQM